MCEFEEVLNIEDDIFKHIAIKRALEFCGIHRVDHATNSDEGLRMLDASLGNEPYDLLVLDMQFPVSGKYHGEEAGIYVMEQLKKKLIDIPIIICSSLRLRIEGAVDCLFYNKSRDLNMDMRNALKQIK